MRRTLAVMGAVSLAASVFLLDVAAGAEAPEPELQGRPLSEWIAQLMDTNRGKQVRAARALSEAPEEIRPAIIEKLRPILASERENDRFVAAQVLGDYGPAARAAAPDLLPVLQGTQFERNRAAAAKSLGQILKNAKPSEEVEKVAEALVAVFNDKYSDVRREAVYACGMIGPAAKACVPHLPDRFNDTEWLKDAECFLVRRAAAWTAGRMGEHGAVHIDRLIAMMHSNRPGPTEFIDAIGEIGPVHDNVVPNIVDKLEKTVYGGWQGVSGEEQSNYAMHCLMVLERFGAKSGPAVDLLVRLLDPKDIQRDPARAVQVLRTLAAIGGAAAKAVPVIEKNALAAGNEQVRKAAEDALKALKK